MKVYIQQNLASRVYDYDPFCFIIRDFQTVCDTYGSGNNIAACVGKNHEMAWGFSVSVVRLCANSSPETYCKYYHSQDLRTN